MSDLTPEGERTPLEPLPVEAPPVAAEHHLHLAAAEGPDAHERPQPRLALALSGGGGAVVAAGLTAVILGDDASQAKGVVAGVVILAIALGVRLAARRSPEVMSAGLGAGAVGILVTLAAAMADMDAVTWPALALAVTFGLAWLLPGFQGRPLMLGMAAAFAVIGLVAATSQITDDSISAEECDRIYAEGGMEAMPAACFGDVSSGNPVNALVEGDTTPEGVVAVLCGAALMVGVLVLDRRGLRGTATPLIPAGIGATWVGLASMVPDLSETGGPVLVVMAGLLIGSVGNAGRRRATTWWGAIVTVAGTVAFMVSVVKPEGASGLGGALLLSGALLILAAAIAVVLHNRSAEEPSVPEEPPAVPVA